IYGYECSNTFEFILNSKFLNFRQFDLLHFIRIGEFIFIIHGRFLVSNVPDKAKELFLPVIDDITFFEIHLRVYQQTYRKEKSRSEEHTSELQSRENLVCRLL